MSTAYKLARFQVGSDLRRRRMYVAARTAPVVALAFVFLCALLGTTGLMASAGILRLLFTFTR